jgi:hypothetical protein
MSGSIERIAYVTDVEGRWDKLATFAEGNDDVRLEADDTLVLADGVTLVFGGDVCDRGPHARRLVTTLLAAKRRYGERVVLLAGNRDLNKLRLRRELDGHPPPRTPSELCDGPRAPLLRWILANTMGAREAFEHRRAELATSLARLEISEDAVAESFLEDVAPGGPMLAYLRACRLAHRAGPTLFVHGGVTSESLGTVPGRTERVEDLDAWIAALDELLALELDLFERGGAPDTILAYQAPKPGTLWNQASVVYGRLADEEANPSLPDEAVVRALAEAGIARVVVGHTPSGDCPAVLRERHASRAGFELVLADNSYGRIERGSSVSLTHEETRVSGVSELDDGTRVAIAFRTRLSSDEDPLGRRVEATGALVKARLASGEYLLFRGLPERRVSQTLATERELAAMRLAPAR